MSDEKKESAKVEVMTPDQALAKMLKIMVNAIVEDHLNEIDFDSYVDARVRAVLTKIKNEH